MRVYLSVIFVSFLILGCTDPGSESKEESHLLEGHENVMDKAKGVEQVIKKGADRQKEVIEK